MSTSSSSRSSLLLSLFSPRIGIHLRHHSHSHKKLDKVKGDKPSKCRPTFRCMIRWPWTKWKYNHSLSCPSDQISRMNMASLYSNKTGIFNVIPWIPLLRFSFVMRPSRKRRYTDSYIANEQFKFDGREENDNDGIWLLLLKGAQIPDGMSVDEGRWLLNSWLLKVWWNCHWSLSSHHCHIHRPRRCYIHWSSSSSLIVVISSLSYSSSPSSFYSLIVVIVISSSLSHRCRCYIHWLSSSHRRHLIVFIFISSSSSLISSHPSYVDYCLIIFIVTPAKAAKAIPTPFVKAAMALLLLLSCGMPPWLYSLLTKPSRHSNFELSRILTLILNRTLKFWANWQLPCSSIIIIVTICWLIIKSIKFEQQHQYSSISLRSIPYSTERVQRF